MVDGDLLKSTVIEVEVNYDCRKQNKPRTRNEQRITLAMRITEGSSDERLERAIKKIIYRGNFQLCVYNLLLYRSWLSA
jgi:hypothetical protein